MTTAQKETLGFQSEAKQLLHLMIHSLYSNKEIFLREFVSNANDAIEKLRFESLSDTELASVTEELRIRIDVDEDAKTVTISDNGIGMTREEVMDNIGRRFEFPDDTPAIILTDDYNPIDVFDVSVREEVRQRILNNTDWKILGYSG